MKKEWIEANQGGKPRSPLSNFDYAAMLTETILLGNVAMRRARPSTMTPPRGGSPTARPRLSTSSPTSGKGGRSESLFHGRARLRPSGTGGSEIRRAWPSALPGYKTARREARTPEGCRVRRSSPGSRRRRPARCR